MALASGRDLTTAKSYGSTVQSSNVRPHMSVNLDLNSFLNGLGGTHVNTSKVMIIQAGEDAGTDVEYTAVQVGTDLARNITGQAVNVDRGEVMA